MASEQKAAHLVSGEISPALIFLELNYGLARICGQPAFFNGQAEHPLQHRKKSVGLVSSDVMSDPPVKCSNLCDGKIIDLP
ncbi:MAG TPA: hypothetical protein VFQ69_09515 [Rhizomicrobium sp.]|nr:hypothetical protein [Rhizomicrobium sp.]